MTQEELNFKKYYPNIILYNNENQFINDFINFFNNEENINSFNELVNIYIIKKDIESYESEYDCLIFNCFSIILNNFIIKEIICKQLNLTEEQIYSNNNDISILVFEIYENKKLIKLANLTANKNLILKNYINQFSKN